MAAISNVANTPYPVDYRLMKNLLMSAKAVAPYLVGTMPGTLAMNAGTASVKWERIENLAPATTPLGELTDDAMPSNRPPVIPVITPITADMLKYGSPIKMVEELELMSVNARANRFTRKLGENAGRSLALVAANKWEADIDADATGVGDNRIYAGGTNTGVPATDRGTVDAILGGVHAQFANNFLNRNDGIRFRPEGFGSTNIATSPIRQSYIGIVHSDVEEDVRQMGGFIASEQYGGYTSLYVGEFGTAGGVRWISTSLAPVYLAAGGPVQTGIRGTVNTDVYVSYVYAEEALGTVGLGEQHTKEIYKTGDRLPTVQMFQGGPGGIGDMLHELTYLSWKSWFVARVLNNNWVTKLESGASLLAT